MSRLIRLTSVFLAALILSGAQYPAPAGHVNTDLLDKETAEALEAQLREFNSATSIEIAVVSVESLNGQAIEQYANELFNRWGIGKSGHNNGVLLLVAPNERAVRIEVGYGLEPYLTDARSRRIIDRAILPRFRQGQMAQGIVDGANAIITDLGTTPWADREERRRLDEAERARRAKEAADSFRAFVSAIATFLAALLGAGASGLGLLWIARQVREWNRRRRLRTFLRNVAIPKLRGGAKEVESEIQATLHAARSTVFGPGELRTLEEYERTASAQMASLMRIASNIEGLVAKDPDAASKALVESAHKMLDKLVSLEMQIQGVADSYVAKMQEFPSLQAAIEKEIDSAETYIRGIAGQGYKTGTAQGVVAQAKAELRQAVAEYVAKDVSAAKVSLDRAQELAVRARTDMEATVLQRARVATMLAGIGNAVADLRKREPQARATLEEICKQFPDAVVAQAKESLRVGLATLESIPGMLKKAEAANSMDSQEFADAEAQGRTIESLLWKAEDRISWPERVLREQTSARTNIQFTYRAACNARNECGKVVAHADVSTETANRYTSTSNEFKQLIDTNRLNALDLTEKRNWWMLEGALKQFAKAFSDIASEAREEIEAAEERRRQERRREERRREEEERRRRSAYYGSGSGFHSSSSSGFGGFGGGFSGGGGTTGRW